MSNYSQQSLASAVLFVSSIFGAMGVAWGVAQYNMLKDRSTADKITSAVRSIDQRADTGEKLLQMATDNKARLDLLTEAVTQDRWRKEDHLAWANELQKQNPTIKVP